MTNYTATTDIRKSGQSPIDLIDEIVRPKRFPPLILNGHWLKDGNATLFNDGSTVKIFLNGDRIPSTVFGGPLVNDEYEFYNAHFHWGEDDCRGAEHTINGTWFSMESHIVHWNRKYLTFEECLKHRDGLCVLAYLFLIQPGSCQWNNVRFDKISENLQYVQNAGSEIKIPSNSLSWMRIATNCPNYYTYLGSYNIGANLECVTWIVFPVIIPIQSCQASYAKYKAINIYLNFLNEFRKLRDKKDKFIKSNWKDVQLLRGRQIFLAIS